MREGVSLEDLKVGARGDGEMGLAWKCWLEVWGKRCKVKVRRGVNLEAGAFAEEER